MGKLDGQVAIVTGSGRGIGKGIALKLAEEGTRVVVADVIPERDETAQEILAKGGKARAVHTDVSQSAQVKALIGSTLETDGQIDLLVNNAGVEINGAFEDVTEDEWDKLYSVNVKGVFLGCKYVLPHMKQRQSGCIINIGSAVAVKGFPQFVAYSGTKGAVLQITRALALEVRDYGIRVNCVCPGLTDTPMGQNALAGYGEGAEQIIRQTQMRWGQPEDIAKAVAFVASDDGAFIIGQPIHVDGGLTT